MLCAGSGAEQSRVAERRIAVDAKAAVRGSGAQVGSGESRPSELEHGGFTGSDGETAGKCDDFRCAPIRQFLGGPTH